MGYLFACYPEEPNGFIFENTKCWKWKAHLSICSNINGLVHSKFSLELRQSRSGAHFLVSCLRPAHFSSQSIILETILWILVTHSVLFQNIIISDSVSGEHPRLIMTHRLLALVLYFHSQATSLFLL